MTEPTTAPKTFEATLSELEVVVQQLEGGSLPLEEALDHYQRGMALLRQCQDRLDAAEQQIKALEGDMLVPFPTKAPPPG